MNPPPASSSSKPPQCGSSPLSRSLPTPQPNQHHKQKREQAIRSLQHSIHTSPSFLSTTQPTPTLRRPSSFLNTSTLPTLRSHPSTPPSPSSASPMTHRRSFLRPDRVSFFPNTPSSARSSTFIEVDLDHAPYSSPFLFDPTARVASPAPLEPRQCSVAVDESESDSTYPDSTFSFSTHPSVCGHVDGSGYQSRNSTSDSHLNSFDVKLQFLMSLAEALIKFGSPAYRMEYLLLLASQTLKVPLTVSVLPNLILMRIAKETVILTVKQGYDLEKLFQTNLLCKALAAKQLAIEQAAEDIEDLIDSPPTWNHPVYIMACAGCSACIAPLLFNGSVGDAVLSLILGFFVGVMDITALKFEAFRYVYEVTTATLVSLIATLLKLGLESSCKPTLFEDSGMHLCYTGITLSTLYIILPGLSIATSFIELYSLNVISGSVRLAVGLVKMLSLAFGITLGSRIGLNIVDSWYPESVAQCFRERLFIACPSSAAVVSMDYRLWAIFPMIVGFALCQCVQLRASPQQFGICIGAVFAAFWSFEGFSYLNIGHELSAALSAFCVGIFGNIYSRISRNPGIAPILSGILLLVPGGLAVQSSLSLIGTSPVTMGGASGPLLVQMILISLSVALGVLFSRIVPPLETQLKTSRIVELRKKLATSLASSTENESTLVRWKRQWDRIKVRSFTRRSFKKGGHEDGIPLEEGYHGKKPRATARCHQKARFWLRRWDWQVKRGSSARIEQAKVKKWLYRYDRSVLKPKPQVTRYRKCQVV